jgi:Na+/glutamate symporter
LTQKPNFLAASCCKVEVVKGAYGALLLSFLFASTSLKSNFQEAFSSKLSFLFFHSFIFSKSLKRVARTFKTFSFELKFFTFHQILLNIALNLIFSAFNFQLSASNTILTFQLSSGLNFFISLSLSTINFTATDCTLPADNHFLILLHKTGLTLYQTNLSKILLAC